MGLQQFYGKGQPPLLWAGWQAAREKIKISEIFIVCTWFTMWLRAVGWRPIGSASISGFPITIFYAVIVTVMCVKYPAYLVVLNSTKVTTAYLAIKADS